MMNNLRLKMSLLIIAFYIFLAAISLIWLPYPIDEIDISARFLPPSLTHIFGTDQLGRDLFSLIMAGARISIFVAFLAVGLGMAFGVPLGLLASSRFGGWIDEIFMRGSDLIFAFPALISAVILTAVFGQSEWNAILAIGIFNIPVFAKLTRGAALEIWSKSYVQSARLYGKSTMRLAFEHVLVGILSLLMVQATIQFSIGILAEAGLSFVGLGSVPPTPSWGRMLAENQNMARLAPHVIVIPGLTIILFVLALNVLGDALRERFDPQNRYVEG